MEIINVIKVSTSKCEGHVFSNGPAAACEKILNAKPQGSKERGSHELRWEVGMGNDAKALGERCWGNLARNR
jgi:hypothetical protein